MARDGRGRFSGKVPARADVEIATVQRGEFLSPLTIQEYPELNEILNTRTRGQGRRFFRTMLATDADLVGFLSSLFDDVLHYPRVILPASDSPEHLEHARFIKFALAQIPHSQNIQRHILESYTYGFTVLEKVYRVVDRGEWRGAVIYENLFDRPNHWFHFDLKRRLRLRTPDNYSPGELLDPEKFMVFTFGSNSNPYGEPVLLDCYHPWLVKHHLIEMLAIYYEKWALPTPVTEFSPGGSAESNAKARREGLAVAMSVNRENAISMPKGMALSLLESKRSGSVAIENGISLCTEMESRAVSGQVLASMVGEHGTYGQSKVHAKQQSNRVETLADYESSMTSRLFVRDLVDRTYGPPEDGMYPRVTRYAKSPVDRQAEATLEQMQIANGHDVSRSASAWRQQIVAPEDDGDRLVANPNLKPGQALPVSAQLAAGDEGLGEEYAKFAAVGRSWVSFAGARADVWKNRVELAARAGLYEEMQPKAEQVRARLQKIAAQAAEKARPAIKRLVGRLAARAKEKKSVEKLTRAFLVKGLRGAGADVGRVFQRMFDQAESVKLADGDSYDGLSDAAKIALALLAIQALERVYQAAQDAGDSVSPEDFAKSLTENTPDSPTEVFSRLFEGTHITDIASVHTANLRRHLDSPAFRAQFPYVMISSRNATRLSHQLMDGYVMSAEEARYSSNLPPFDYGCGKNCIAVPIPEATARRRGLTGAAPTGNLVDYVRAKGGDERFGLAPGFLPAYAGTDARAQLALIRQKLEVLRREDPSEWAAVYQWLLVLFGYDILVRDPEQEREEEVA